jgi:hypothetical protein
VPNVIECSNETNQEFYYAFDARHGGVSLKVNRRVIDEMTKMYQRDCTLGNGIWEFNVKSPCCVEVRVTPSSRLDGRDDLWRTCDYTLYLNDSQD